jgi:S-DNA-T family DNA segregation ATPase FtsK/SpoIIIE
MSLGSSRHADRWRDAARVAVVSIGMALSLMVVHGTGLGPAALSAFDWAAYPLPLFLAAIGLDLLRRTAGERPLLHLEEVNGLISLFLAVLITCGSQHHGGPLGNALADQLTLYIGTSGTALAAIFFLALGLVLAVHATLAHGVLGVKLLAGGVKQVMVFCWHGSHHLVRELGRLRLPARPARPRPSPAPPIVPLLALPSGPAQASDQQAAAGAPRSGKRRPGRTAGPASEHAESTSQPGPDTRAPHDDAAEAPQDQPENEQMPGSAWTIPPLDILERAPAEPEVAPGDNALRMRVIEDTLASFNVRARVIDAHSGPAVTQFDVQPERGVRVQRVTALQNDLALALAARSIRIQAPVPGQSVIGIEIPNARTSVVALRDVMESEACTRMKAPLTIALGKDVSGGPVLADLARMPHLLIAGATGSGKSVCLNSLISCLLFHNGPDRVRLLMVDPKMVELTVFNDVPHLLTPVVTDVKKVTNLLKWALKEMHRRYKLFAEVGARNVTRYNEMQTAPKDRLPFIVIVIDELADLMMVSPEDIEEHICRLAQLARATGMHLVLATQRPSVDVITGLIKANFPARIAFAVSSQVDSRTILDQAGAEKLLGRGDMLYQPSDEGKPIRVQGAYIHDREIEELVRFWKQNPARSVERIPDADLEVTEKGGDDDQDEKLMNDAIQVLREYRRASVSLLQRRLSIGYTRAARLLDALEDRGVVGPSEDGRSRIVLDAAGTDDHEDFATDDDEAPPL